MEIIDKPPSAQDDTCAPTVTAPDGTKRGMKVQRAPSPTPAATAEAERTAVVRCRAGRPTPNAPSN